MKIHESDNFFFRYALSKDNFFIDRLTTIALTIFAGFGALFANIGRLLLFVCRQVGLRSQNTPSLPPSPPPENLTALFYRAVDATNPTRPKINQGEEYGMLIRHRLQLESDLQKNLFYAELCSICNEDGILMNNPPTEKLERFAQTFLRYSPNYWGQEIQNLYRSILSEYLCQKYKIHFNDAKKLTTVSLKGQELIIQEAKDNGDCLFLSFISGLTETDPPSVVALRKLASEALSEAIKQPDGEGLMYQLAEGMRMHHDAHSGVPQEDLLRQTCESFGFAMLKDQFSNNPRLKACKTKEAFFREWRRQNPPQEEESDPKELALEFCNRLVKPGEIYPGEETIKILAESLEQPIVIVNGDSLRYFGPEMEDDFLPIFIYKMPGNAHYNRLVVDPKQWDALRKFCN